MKNLIKNIHSVISLFVLSFIITINIWNPIIAQADVMSPQMAESMETMFGDLSDAELEQLFEFSEQLYESLDPETKRQIDRMGEQWAQEVERGEDPMEALERIVQKDEQEAEQEEPTAEEPLVEEDILKKDTTAEEITTKTIIRDEKKMTEAKDIVESILDKISTIRVEASLKKSVEEKLYPLSYNLDDIVYYLEVIKNDDIIKYLQDEEFKALFNALQTLESTLSTYVPQLKVQEMSLAGEDPYSTLGIPTSATLDEVEKAFTQRLNEKNPYAIKSTLQEEGKSDADITAALENIDEERKDIIKAYHEIKETQISKEAFKKILEALGQAVFGDNILQDLEKLLKKYDPEALKLKKEQEKKENEARIKQLEEAKREPWFTWAFEPADFYGSPYDIDDYAYDDYQDYGSYDYDTTPYEPSDRTPSSFTPAGKRSSSASGKKPAGKKASSPQQKKGADKSKKEQKKPAKPKKKPATKKPMSDTAKSVGIIITEEFGTLNDYLEEKKTILSTVVPYLKENEEITRARKDVEQKTKIAEMKKTLEDVTEKINTLNRKIDRHYNTTLKGSSADQAWYKNKVNALLKKLNDSKIMKDVLENLVSISWDEKENKYTLYFDTEKKQRSTRSFEENDNLLLKEKNYIKNLQDALSKLEKGPQKKK